MSYLYNNYEAWREMTFGVGGDSDDRPESYLDIIEERVHSAPFNPLPAWKIIEGQRAAGAREDAKAEEVERLGRAIQPFRNIADNDSELRDFYFNADFCASGFGEIMRKHVTVADMEAGE